MTHLNILKKLLPELTDGERQQCVKEGEAYGLKTVIDEFIIKRRSINKEKHLEFFIQRNEIKVFSTLLKTEGMSRDDVKRQKDLRGQMLLNLLIHKAISEPYEYLLNNPDKRI